MLLTPRTRKLVLTTHLVSTLGWTGALAVFLALSILGLAGADPFTVRASYVAMAVSAWYVILPASIVSVATGLLQAVATPWGLVRHYWVIAKLSLTAIAAGVLMLKLGPIGDLAVDAAGRDFGPSDVRGVRISMLVHAVGGLVILLSAVVLAVYKPAGVSSAPMPPWAKISAVAVGTLAVLVVAMLLAGGHGPRMH